MDYKAYHLQESFSIREIITFYYLQLPSHYLCPPEQHDFWEFLYVDKGEMTVETNSGRHHMSQSDIIFYEPNEYHVGGAADNSAPNVVVLSFKCNDPCMAFFRGKILRLNDQERDILSRLIKEGTQAFNPPIDSPNIEFPIRWHAAPFASEQMIRNYLEIFLILIIRRNDSQKLVPSGSPTVPVLCSNLNSRSGRNIINQIIGYLHQHTHDHLTIDQIGQVFHISRSYLMTEFKTRTGYSLIEYFNLLKIDQSKLLIREGSHTMSQIADWLTYKDLGTFSRQFKKITGMSPTEYQNLVKK